VKRWAARADTSHVANLYDVMHVNGDTYEVDADFFQRDGEDWVFYLADVEVMRLPFLDVLSVTKAPAWIRDPEPAVPEVWL
jgi:hypothetical protein